jgi:hypothetical protein
MKIRLEFGYSRSISFPWVLRLCKKFPSYKEFEDEGIRIYSIEVTNVGVPAGTDPDITSLEAIFNRVRGWNQVAYFINDKLTSASDVFRHIWDRKYRRQRALYKGNVKDVIDSL